ncbi:MAG: MotA/TolQ/ExbB proton channel family protein, partial [Bacteroidaceae bacterium]|nr:MotA/TolQ/ExbB proton channel family protein [Bacteroidaceae bacterium]
MKKLFAIVALAVACSFGATSTVMAQEDVAQTPDTAVVDSAAVDTAAVDTAVAEAPEAAPIVEEQN